jgi:hypothetical protein
VGLSLCQVIINGGNMTIDQESLGDVSMAMDTVSNYAEEIHWHGRHTLISMLDDLYTEQVKPYLYEEDI